MAFRSFRAHKAGLGTIKMMWLSVLVAIMAFSTSAELQAGPAASILRFTPEALACVKRSVERVK